MNQHRPGETVSRFGVYQAHHKGHVPKNEEITILKGGTFPTCLRCGENVVFQPLHMAREINAVPRFNRPVPKRRTNKLPPEQRPASPSIFGMRSPLKGSAEFGRGGKAHKQERLAAYRVA